MLENMLSTINRDNHCRFKTGHCYAFEPLSLPQLILVFHCYCNKLSPTACKNDHVYYLTVQKSEFQNRFQWTKIKVSPELCSFCKLQELKESTITQNVKKECKGI